MTKKKTIKKKKHVKREVQKTERTSPVNSIKILVAACALLAIIVLVIMAYPNNDQECTTPKERKAMMPVADTYPCPDGSVCLAGKPVACKEGYYPPAPELYDQCLMCPPNAVCPEGTEYIGCEEGYHLNPDSVYDECIACPEGKTCAGGVEQPK